MQCSLSSHCGTRYQLRSFPGGGDEMRERHYVYLHLPCAAARTRLGVPDLSCLCAFLFGQVAASSSGHGVLSRHELTGRARDAGRDARVEDVLELGARF